MYDLVENIKRPLKLGELFLVPCIIKEMRGRKMQITPVVNFPHNDAENDQPHAHYHADFRFVKTDADGQVINKHSKHFWCWSLRLQENISGRLVHLLLPVVDEAGLEKYVTDVKMIGKSKMKHDCIHKDKCPHRGYDLSQVAAKDGKIVCPMHGLTFDADTKKILNFKPAI